MNLNLQNAIKTNQEILTNQKTIRRLHKSNEAATKDLNNYLKDYVLSEDFKKDSVFEIVQVKKERLNLAQSLINYNYELRITNKYITSPIFNWQFIIINNIHYSFVFDRKGSPHIISVIGIKEQIDKLYKYFTS